MSDNTAVAPAAPESTDATVEPKTVGIPWDDDQDETAKPDSDEPKETKDEQKPAAKKEKKWITVKVDGKEERITEEDLIRSYQKGKSADRRLEEAAKAQKSVEQFMRALQEDPEAVLNNPNLSIDRRKLAEKWLYEQIQQELNPPDERDLKLREYEERLKRYESIEQEEAQTKEEREYNQAVAKRKEELGQVFSEAMSKSSLSKNPETAAATLREMALYYRAYKERTGEAPDAEELAQHVEQKYFKGLYELANTLDGEELVQFLGPQIIKKLRAYDLGQLTKKSQTFEAPEAKGEDWGTARRPKEQKRMTPQDAKEMARKMLLG